MNINTNMPSIYARNNINTNHTRNAQAAQKLASGLSINKAADNAAGLAIVEAMLGQIGGMDQATRNTQDSISMVQTTDGALAEDDSTLDRMRQLSVQAANGTYTDSQRSMIQNEMDQLKGGINDISNNTSFNNINLLDGSAQNLTFQTGPNELNNMQTSIGKMDSTTLGVDSLDVTNVSAAGHAISSIDQASAGVSSQRSTLGAVQNGLTHSLNYLGISKENQVSAESSIQDADMAAQIMDYTRTNILQQVGTAMSSQANMQSGQVLRLLMG